LWKERGRIEENEKELRKMEKRRERIGPEEKANTRGEYF